ncbi:MAG: peptidase M15 [Candidatus Dadabacteria bacterium]|nr:peptidase M15 [Candidatus Dadabacteria bacterium]NIQ15792.1 peptidase M15 [Candidatus Dadabacteria bacterium]
MKKYLLFLLSLLFILSGCIKQPLEISGDLPRGFVYVDQIIPDIKIDLRYYGNDNFIGKRVDGYIEPKCILTARAAYALKKVQGELRPFGLSLKIYDAYRPQQAVDHFVRWSEDTTDKKMKNTYYPNINKNDLIKEEFIASESSHSRGSAVDLTIVSLYNENKELNMGSGFDYFGKKSFIDYKDLDNNQRANRLLLNSLMKKHGFVPYSKEWWHFKLRKEPFPKTYFNFPVK